MYGPLGWLACTAVAAPRRRAPSAGSRAVVAGALFLVALAWTSPAEAQVDVSQIFGPRVGGVEPRGAYRGAYHADRPVAGREGDFGLARHDLSFLLPLAQSDREEWTLRVTGRLDDVGTRVRLPDTGERFPHELWDLAVGLGHRRRLERGWIGGAALRVGSPSDEPFHSTDEVSVRAATFVRIPRGPREALVLSLNYANDRPLLNHVPLPGIAYAFAPWDRVMAIVGFPFASVELGLAEPLTLRASYVFPRRANASLTYDVSRTVALYGAFDWDEARYFRADRERRSHGLTYVEKRGAAGVRFRLAELVGLDLSGGYAFDRLWFEGEDWDDRGQNRLNLGDGPFGAASVAVRF